MIRIDNDISFVAPFSSPDFTVLLPGAEATSIRLQHKNSDILLRSIPERRQLTAGTCCKTNDGWLACFDLPKGQSVLRMSIPEK